MDQLTLSYVWKQKQIPVVLRRTGRGERIRVRLPFADDNRHWLQNGRRTAPEWIGGTEAYWELPKSWFNDLVDRALVRYGKISFSSTASRRSAREHARKRSVMSANVHAWALTTVPATTEAGSKSPIPFRHVGATGNWPAVC